MKYFKFLFVILIASSVSKPILASEKKVSWYQIEVIVFSQSDLSGVHSESWPKPGNNTLLLDSVKLSKPIVIHPLPETPDLAMPFEELSKSAFELKLTDAKLERSPRYRRLVHKAWIQPVEKDKKIIPVLLDDSDHTTKAYQELSDTPVQRITRKTRSLDGLLDTTEKSTQESFVIEELEESIDWPTFFPNMIPALPTFNDSDSLSENWELHLSDFTPEYASYESDFTPREITGPPYHSVFGTLGLRMGRFLHIDVDISFRTNLNVLNEIISTPLSLEEYENSTSLSPNELKNKNIIDTIDDTLNLPIIYRLKESMRIKSGKIYYFDHPLFGVITMVNKFELPLEKNPEAIHP